MPPARPPPSEHLVSAPFQRKFASLFINFAEENKFFTYAQREMLTHQILKKIDISMDIERNSDSADLAEERRDTEEPLRRKGLEFLLMEDAYESAFVLHQPSEAEEYFKVGRGIDRHQWVQEMKEQAFEADRVEDDPRLRLSKVWCSWWRFQPLGELRDYFGEQIAFYFGS